MWEFIVQQVVGELVVPMLGVIVTGFAIPALVGFMRKNNIEVAEKEVSILRQFGQDAVRLAEVTMRSGPEKKREALQNLLKTSTEAGVGIAKHNLDRVIEAAHKEVFSNK
jgi:hypothetical protein